MRDGTHIEGFIKNFREVPDGLSLRVQRPFRRSAQQNSTRSYATLAFELLCGERYGRELVVRAVAADTFREHVASQ